MEAPRLDNMYAFMRKCQSNPECGFQKDENNRNEQGLCILKTL